MWRNRSYGETVKTFIDKLVLWQRTGYVAGQVWEKIRTIVEPSLLPVELPLPTAMKRWDDDNTPAKHRVALCVLEEDCKYIV